MSSPTHYQVLGLSPTASHEQIRKAYRTLAKQHHPDTKTDTASPERFARLSAAYEVLSDPAKRREYDDLLEQQAARETGAGRAHFTWANVAAKPRERGVQDIHTSEFDELYDTFFTKPRTKPGKPSPG